MGYKIRAVKKAYKEPIEVLKDVGFLGDYYYRYRGLILGLIGLSALGAVVGLVVWQLSLRAERQAWALEAEAGRLYRENPELAAIMERKEIGDKNEHFKKALALYQEIVEKFPRTTAAPLAAYYIGNIQFELKEFDNAIASYRAFLSQYGSQDPLAPFVQSKLAYVYQQTGNEQEALKLFQTVMGNDKALNQDQAYYEVGRIYEKLGVKEEAIAAYEKASQTFKNSPWATEASARLAMLKPASASSPSQPVPSSAGAASPTGQGGKPNLPMVRIEKGPDGKMTVTPVEPGKETPGTESNVPQESSKGK